MTTCLLAVCLLAAAPVVELTPLDGVSVRGPLVGLNAEEISLQVEQEVRTFLAAAVEEVRFPGVSNDFSTLQVRLVDETELHPSRVKLTGGKVSLTFSSGAALEIPAKQVRSVLLKKQSPELAKQWAEIAKGVRSSDAVVVRRKTMKPAGETKSTTAGEDSLDFLEGTVTAISEENVEFDLGDDQSSLKRERLDGIVFAPRGAAPPRPTKFRLLDTVGSRFHLASFTADEDGLSLDLACGVKWQVPQKEIAAIDFSPGNVHYLDADPPDVTEVSFDLVPASLKAGTSKFFEPKRISPASGERLRLGDQSFNRGVLLHGEARLVYQVPAGFQRFTAIAGLPVTAGKQAFAKLSITADGQTPWEQTLSVRERGPFVIDLPVTGAKRITIRLEDAPGLDIADQVLLCKARFLK